MCPGGHERVEVCHDLGDTFPGDEPCQIEPVGADVGHGAEITGGLWLESPIPVRRS